MDRSHASAHHSFSVVMLTPHLWASLRAQRHHGYSPQHGRVNRWKAKHVGSSRQWQLRAGGPPSAYLALLSQRSDPPWPCLLSSFICASCMFFCESELLKMAHIKCPVTHVVHDFNWMQNISKVYDLHWEKDYYVHVSCAASLSSVSRILFLGYLWIMLSYLSHRDLVWAPPSKLLREIS